MGCSKGAISGNAITGVSDGPWITNPDGIQHNIRDDDGTDNMPATAQRYICKSSVGDRNAVTAVFAIIRIAIASVIFVCIALE